MIFVYKNEMWSVFFIARSIEFYESALHTELEVDNLVSEKLYDFV